jgi:3-hydroxyacyl-CoA dehydrogenase
MKEIKNFVVLGAGAMGAQIGALAAESGFNVKIRVSRKNISREAARLLETTMINELNAAGLPKKVTNRF